MGPLWVHIGGTLYSGDDWYDRDMRLEVECGGRLCKPLLMASIQLCSILVQSTWLLFNMFKPVSDTRMNVIFAGLEVGGWGGGGWKWMVIPTVTAM